MRCSSENAAFGVQLLIVIQETENGLPHRAQYNILFVRLSVVEVTREMVVLL